MDGYLGKESKDPKAGIRWRECASRCLRNITKVSVAAGETVRDRVRRRDERAEQCHREGAGVTVQNEDQHKDFSSYWESEARARLSVEECRDLTYN